MTATRSRRRRHRAVVAAAVVVVVVAATVALVVRPRSGAAMDSAELADGGRVAASSTALGYTAQSAVIGATAMPSQGWRSDSQTIGAWIEISWPTAHELHSVTIARPGGSSPNVTAGVLAFGDGSRVQVMLPVGTRTVVLPFTPRTVRSVRFVASGFANDATATTLARFAVNASDDSAVHDPRGDAGAAATVTASVAGNVTGLVRDGAEWSTDSPSGAEIRFSWSRPRELVSVTVAGVRGSTATVASATLRFSDGSQVPIGAVPADPERPTTVAFMPHVVRDAVLEIRSIAGSGRLRLAAVELTEQGTNAAPEQASEGTTVIAPTASCDQASPAVAGATLQVLCPEDGARVDDSTTLVVAVPTGANRVSVDAWPSVGDASIPTVVRSGSGAVRVPLDLRGLPDGPVTVSVSAPGGGQPVQLRLLHGQAPARTVASSRAARGRTLVYDEEFDGPLSVSRSGAGARYAAGKPETGSVTDFGSAIFADPDDGHGNVGTLDDGYLRLAVSPKPARYADPLGWDRTSIGGMLASARPGGSGFSAQYGYFEARMLAPAAPGTWPAFWLLPSDNLVTPQRSVAEIDAVELYGHDPLSACQTTHAYRDGEDSGVAACGRRFSSARGASQWHTYGVDVTPSEVVFYIDGQRVARSPQVQGGEAPMFFLVDLALGGGWPIQLSGTRGRAQLLVDSIRVYV